MTNQEWLCNLSAEDFLCHIKWLLQNYGKRWTDSDPAIIEWLQGKHEVNSEDKEMRIEVSKGDGITMPNSLKCKIKHLCHNGTINERERDRILKALEQEPKTGHWIEEDGYDGDTYYDCSVCGESWTTIEGTPWNNGMRYCPKCGAKMESEDEK